MHGRRVEAAEARTVTVLVLVDVVPAGSTDTANTANSSRPPPVPEAPDSIAVDDWSATAVHWQKPGRASTEIPARPPADPRVEEGGDTV